MATLIRRVVVEHFKRFDAQVFELDTVTVLAGPNNTGKSTLLQALSVWNLALRTWLRARSGEKSKKRVRVGVPLPRQAFSAVPVRDLSLLWTDRRTAFTPLELAARGEQVTTPRLKPLRITVEGDDGPGTPTWQVGMELRFANSELLYVRPVGARDSDTVYSVPEPAQQLSVVHVPPFSGIGAEEYHYDPGAQDKFIGQGKAGDILRNLLLTASEGPEWDDLVETVRDLFGYKLLKPDYSADRPHIVCEYEVVQGKRRLRLDIASAGSGFHQVLILFAFFYARRGAIFLLDEPDAHLHVILQRTVYERLRRLATARGSQLIVATHAEVLIDDTPPNRVLSFVGPWPHRLASETERQQVREALRRLTTMDILLADQGRAVLYVESRSDLSILKAWAEVLDHPAARPLSSILVHALGGHRPQEAKAHFFALQAVRPEIRGMVILDRDHRDVPDREIITPGLEVRRWNRYEIENYLLVPSALERFAAKYLSDIPGDHPGQPNLFRGAMTNAIRRLFPPSAIEDPLGSPGLLAAVKASEEVLPQLLAEAQIDLPKSDYYQIAAEMNASEIHPDVVAMLDAIGRYTWAADGADSQGAAHGRGASAQGAEDGEPADGMLGDE